VFVLTGSPCCFN